MAKIISGIVIEKSTSLTLDEFCHYTHTEREIVIEMVEHQLIEPEGDKPEEWRFDSFSLKRGRIAASFYHDLEINMPGIALALDLLEKIENLQQQLEILEKNK
jgi:chaperone modulatory protein CbpM